VNARAQNLLERRVFSFFCCYAVVASFDGDFQLLQPVHILRVSLHMHKQEPAYAQAEARTLTGCYPNEHEKIRLRNITSDGVQFPLVQDFGIEVSRPNKKEV